MASTYELGKEYDSLVSIVNELTNEDGETRELAGQEMEIVSKWFDELADSVEVKINNICKFITNKKSEFKMAKAEKDALKDEYERLGKREKARENEINRLKGLLGFLMDKLGIQKYKTALFSIGYQATRKSAKPVEGFFNPDEIPVEFLKRELSPTAINKAIEEGRLYEKNDNPLNKGKLFYRDENGEQALKGVSYLGSDTLVIR
jgi:hypothetical protein